MIAYINGKILEKSPTEVVIDINGVGYVLFISLYTYSQIQSLNEVKLFTYLQIKEDSHNLFGFYDLDEKNIFLNLINVSGIGSSTARLMLSSSSPLGIYNMIINSEIKALERIKGIGKKTAERIVVELKDKLLKQNQKIKIIDDRNTKERKNNTLNDTASVEDGKADLYNLRMDVISALVSLGINRTQAENVTNNTMNSNRETKKIEDLIRLALKSLA